MVSVPSGALILMREVTDFSYLLPLLFVLVLGTLHTQPPSASPSGDGTIPACGCVAGNSASWIGGWGGEGFQGNRSSARSAMKSGVGQAGINEQRIWPEQWVQHQGLCNALIRKRTLGL